MYPFDAPEDDHDMENVLIATGEAGGDEENARGEQRKRDSDSDSGRPARNHPSRCATQEECSGTRIIL